MKIRKTWKGAKWKKYEININQKMINDDNNKSDANNKSDIAINNNNDNDENNSESLHKDSEISDYELWFFT